AIPQIRAALEDMMREAAQRLTEDDAAEADWQFDCSLELRYLGQSHEISVPLSEGSFADFEREHRRLYGYALDDRPLELICLRLSATVREPAAFTPEPAENRPGARDFDRLPRQPAYSESGWTEMR